MAVAAKTILKQILDVQMLAKEVDTIGIKIETIDDNPFQLKAEIEGPANTPYQGAKFCLFLEMSKDYPFQPPLITFNTKIWHPNVCSETGVTCFYQQDWCPATVLRMILLTIQSLLSDPEPSDPQDTTVAFQCLHNPELFTKTALYWSQLYANAPGTLNPEFKSMVKQITDMGIEQNHALRALSQTEWDVSHAVEIIFAKNH